jgi:hypothetical protein
MRYSAAEKLEIIHLVEQSHLPQRRCLVSLGILRQTFYRWYERFRTGGPDALADSHPGPIASGTASPMRCKGASSICRWKCRNSRRANWRCALPTKEAISFQKIRSIACRNPAISSQDRPLSRLRPPRNSIPRPLRPTSCGRRISPISRLSAGGGFIFAPCWMISRATSSPGGFALA